MNRRKFLCAGAALTGAILGHAPAAPSEDEIWSLLHEIPHGQGRLAIVVGHTKLRPGAYGVGALGKYEYPFNTSMAQELTEIGKNRGLTVQTFYRDLGGVDNAYSKAFTWGADAVVELHFNSTSRRVDSIRGTETLAVGGERISSFRLAQAIHGSTLSVLNRPVLLDRGVKVCNLRSEYQLPVALIEPVFGNNPVEAKLLADKRQAVANAVVEGFLNFQLERRFGPWTDTVPDDTHEDDLPADLSEQDHG